MKRFGIILAFVLASVTMSAQNYAHSFGVGIGSFFSLQYKAFFKPESHCGLLVDAGCNLIASRMGTKGAYTESEFWTIELNPNFVYQGTMAVSQNGSYLWYAGFGVSGGILNGFADHSLINGKAGANGIIGFEWSCAKLPLLISFDFRPGYGFTFQESFKQSFFDWSLSLSFRRRF